jgi:hypothetical protein
MESRAQRAETAHRMFRERCSRAGTRIDKTVDAVEGILLMKLRPEGINFGKQFALDDPYGSDFGGDAYIEGFLRGSYQANNVMPPNPPPGTPRHVGYRYVEAVDPADGKRYRYTGSRKPVRKKDVTAPNVRRALERDPNFDLNIYDFVLERSPAPGAAPRFGVTYEDISTPEEREYWIAGSSLKVIDVATGEVLAERVGYMMDPGQGIRAGGREPWLMAANNACPAFASRHGANAQVRQTQVFVEKVLQPKEGN